MTDERPVLRVISGDATPEELAAITALIAASGSAQAAAEPPPSRGRWNDPAHSMRRAWAHGEGGWRSAGPG